MALGVDGVERQGGFARTARSGDDDEMLPREFEGDVLQIMFPRALDADVFHQGYGGENCILLVHFLVTTLWVIRAMNEMITPQYDAGGGRCQRGGGC